MHERVFQRCASACDFHHLHFIVEFDGNHLFIMVCVISNTSIIFTELRKFFIVRLFCVADKDCSENFLSKISIHTEQKMS